MSGRMERQMERQVQKQSITNMHITANTPTTVHNVKLAETEQFFNTPQTVTQLMG